MHRQIGDDNSDAIGSWPHSCVGELEAQVTAYQQRADRAEQWLHRAILRLKSDFFSREKLLVQ